MFIFDIPDVPPLVIASTQAPAVAPQVVPPDFDGGIGFCSMVRPGPVSSGFASDYALRPITNATVLHEYKKFKTEFWRFSDSAKVTVLQAPQHGTLVGEGDDTKYYPHADYRGKDRVVFLVEIGGYRIKVLYDLHVQYGSGTDEQMDKRYCPKDEWKISSAFLEGAQLILLNSDQSWSVPSISNISVTFRSLDDQLLGITTENANGADIVLDSDAAGHGWYFDWHSVTDMDSWLPTSIPNEWVARPGTAAVGKMDFLSVYLHEYGHALGLEHSTDSHDLMASTLSPGTRRLPSADELALYQAVGQMAEAGLNTPQPYSPFSPFTPDVPVPVSLTMLLGALRRRIGEGNGGAAESGGVTQYAVAANPALSNVDFANSTGWATTGQVAFTNGTATLVETATAQSRLNQVFVVGASDRFLSFTVSGVALQDQAGPDDAFEVALIDANTGFSLLGSTGLTRNDAILNRQADGSEHRASAVSRVQNADGSTTYLVDLAGIAAGTVVNLSFDLIGFGRGEDATESQVTIGDLRIGVPQTRDDAVTLAEDNAVDIAALGNDLNATQPGFLPVVVSGPAHGTVTFNADGTFRFTPAANWFGEDSFTYALKEVPLGDKLSDAPQEVPLGGGRVDSNISTVSLTVTPVNDAPVAADMVLQVLEDASLSGAT